MGRFLGTASGRTRGAAVASSGGGGGGGVFTKVKVFSTPGSTTFEVPSSSTNVKAIVIGAGSCYRTGTYCHVSSNCCSGVDFPIKCYSMCFTGHLTGAGGGYAEKTFTSAESVPGKTLTINVGSVGGLSASSVSGNGFTTISATNATESSYSWSCTSNSTARDASNDNPVAFGFSLPVCGYQNSISGYYNKGGTASGGDINRSGGDGVLIPEFLYDSYVDGIYEQGAGSSFSGNTSSCWINPTVTCACAYRGYHTTFGGSQFGSTSLVSCICARLCGCITNLCACVSPDTVNSKYTFLGRNTKNTSGFIGAATIDSTADTSANLFINEQPAGVGAQSGTSGDNGKDGMSDRLVTDVGIAKSVTASGSAFNCICFTYTNYGYDYSFGGTGCSRMCFDYTLGRYSSCASFTGTCGSHTWCYSCLGYAFTFFFGSAQSGAAACFCMPYGLAHEVANTTEYNRTYNLGFIQDKSAGKSEEYIIPTSTLLDENGENINDIKYGGGAGITTSASYGGGGNRLYPAAGSGLVVLLY